MAAVAASLFWPNLALISFTVGARACILSVDWSCTTYRGGKGSGGIQRNAWVLSRVETRDVGITKGGDGPTETLALQAYRLCLGLVETKKNRYNRSE